MKFTARGSYIYTPQFEGNRELPEGERMAFEIIRPKAEERGDLYSVERVSRLSEGPGDRDKITYTYRHATGVILRRHIGKITNLTVDTGDGKETPVADGKTLAACPIYGAGDLVDELCVAFELVYTGWHAESWHSEYDEKREQFSFGFLKRKEFKSYLTAEFWEALWIWRRYCRYGLPSGRGWLEEPEAVLELLALFDDARDSLDRLKAGKKTGKQTV